MRQSPERSNTSSPLKVKQFFTNPLHKIKQQAFVEVGFNNSTLSTFIKVFGHKYNSKYISLNGIKSFIKNFTNNNPRLMTTYQQFFQKNFQIKQNGLIQLQHFMEFFIKQQKYILQELSIKNLKTLYNDLQPINFVGLVEKCEQLSIPIDQRQAQNIIRMATYGLKGKSQNQINQQDFQDLMKMTDI